MTSLAASIIQSFSFMLLAHLIADFVLQNKWMVDQKSKWYILCLHAIIVTLTTMVALGGNLHIAAMIGTSHLIIDTAKILVKSKFKTENFLLFAVDQLTHMIVLAFTALYLAQSWSDGFWQPWADLLTGPIIIANGFIMTVIVGNYVTQFTIKPYAGSFDEKGLPKAGKLIGWLERTLIFLLMAIDQTEGIAFLVAAKSFLRFEATKKQEASEYVLVGTLTSFGWALGISALTFATYNAMVTY